MQWADLLTYQLADFIPYDLTAWQRLYQQFLANDALGAVATVCLVLGAYIYLLRRYPARLSLVALLLALAVAWVWLGIRFHGYWHAQLNWAAHYWAALFIVHGVLLVVAALLVQFSPVRHGAWRWRFGQFSIWLMVLPWLMPPLAGVLLSDRSLLALQTVALAPDPTAWFTALLVSQCVFYGGIASRSTGWHWLMMGLSLLIVALAMLSLLLSMAAAWVTGAKDLLLVNLAAVASVMAVAAMRIGLKGRSGSGA